LEADRQFSEDGLKLVNPDDIKGLGLREQVHELDRAVVEDNKRLEKLVREKESEAAEVVSVNIGKKKKRIKKADPMDAMQEAVGGGGNKEKEKEKEKEREKEPKKERRVEKEKEEPDNDEETKSPKSKDKEKDKKKSGKKT